MRTRLAALAGLLLAAFTLLAAEARAGYNACRPFGAKACLLPFPDNRLTVPDKHSVTGVRVHLPAAAMPVNVKGQRIGTGEYNRNDGFSPGGMIIIRIPGLDTSAAFVQNHLPSLTAMGRTYNRRQRLLLIDAATHRRVLIWAELDATPKLGDVNLLVHPGRNLLHGHRYVVVLRNLVGAHRERLRAPAWFAKARSAQPKRYARIRKTLSRAGVGRKGLYATWDFTVISRQSETGRMLAIRNDAFRRLGDKNLADGKPQGSAPKYTIDAVTDNPADNPELLRQVEGTITVPCYLNAPGCPPGARFHYSAKGKDATPTALPGNVIREKFYCNVPRAAASTPARISLYGHGLLGKPTEINAGNVQDMSQEHDFVFCATRWVGMSDEDLGNAANILGDLDLFPSLTDRLQQGVLDMLYLGRLMRSPHGLATNAAFRGASGRPLIDPSRLYYDGNSQGGIEGGITTAVAPDFARAVLGVSGMDYGGLLLARSVDFDSYLTILRSAYPDPSVRPLLYDLLQQLWDRSEPDGYAQYMTGHNLPGTPRHTVLMQIALGDHQVTDYAADTEARTIGAGRLCPSVARGRGRLLYGIPCVGALPYSGSAITYWDSGPKRVALPPLSDTPPRGKGPDPHEDPRSTRAARTQKSAFLAPDGKVVDVCGGRPCRTDVYNQVEAAPPTAGGVPPR